MIPASARTSVTVPPVPGRSTLPPWVVLIVDDEPSVHDVTKLALRRLRFEGRKLELLSAFSAAEAREILQQRRDIAVALVDVVMEDDRAGLDLIGDVRGVFGNRLLRIILRTGQTGLAPELEVIQHFEIDELGHQGLHFVVGQYCYVLHDFVFSNTKRPAGPIQGISCENQLGHQWVAEGYVLCEYLSFWLPIPSDL